MKGFENEIYRYLLLLSVVLSIVILVASFKWPRIAKLLFFVLFAWASWMNWTTSRENPNVYLDYANLTWSGFYRDIIRGWFSGHIRLLVGLIACSQALIALSMLLNGWLFKLGAIGCIIFLLAIIPFGIGSGFPTTAILAIAMAVLLRRHADRPIWKSTTNSETGRNKQFYGTFP